MAQILITLPCVSCGRSCEVQAGAATPLCKDTKCIEEREKRKELARAASTKVQHEVSEDAARNEGYRADVETSEGLVAVGVKEINEGETVDPEQNTGGKKPKKKNAKTIKNSLNKPRERRRQPSYLKSVAQPVVPNPADPEAPLGRDSEDRPIRLPQQDPNLYTVRVRPRLDESTCTADRHDGSCSECKEKRLQAKAHAHNDERERAAQPAPLSEAEKQERERAAMLSYVQKTWFPNGDKILPPPLPPTSWHAATPEQERELREAQRRQEQQQEKELLKQLKAAGNIKDTPFVCLREVLGLTREQVIEWFDFVLSPRLPPPPPPQLTPRDVEGHKEAIAKSRAAIKGLEEEIRGMSAKARGKEFLDDGSFNPSYLDTTTRNRYKRQFNNEIAKHEEEIREHENAKRRKPLVVPSPAVKAIPSRDLYTIEQMPHHTRVSTINRVVRERDFTLEDFLALFLVVRDENSGRYLWTDYYKSAAALRNPPIPDDDYENKVVQLAIQVGACPPPSQELRDRYPQILDNAFAKFFGWGDPSEGDTASENKLITKTGGAQIGGQIASAGLLWNPVSCTFRQRALHTFNLPERSGGGGSSGGSGETDDEGLDDDGFDPD